jgi:transmembrane sensor
MNRNLPTEPIERAEAAALWRVQIESDTTIAQSRVFRTWIADPRNQLCYEQCSAAWDAFEDHLVTPQMMVIRRDALHRAQRSSLRRFVPTRRHFGAIAAVLFLGIVAGFAVWQYRVSPSEFSTSSGERRVITLIDGSRVSLDSGTDVQILFTPSSREVTLKRGRAHFDVAHDIARPFIVAVDRENVVAVGTSFDVEQLSHRVLVTLMEGRVLVKPIADVPKSSAFKPVLLTAGHQMVVWSGAKVPTVSQVNMTAALAWQMGRVILSNETLSEAVERMNRYTDSPLVVDPAISSLRISGAFNAGDTGSFVDAVTSYFPVQASINAQHQIVLQKRS